MSIIAIDPGVNGGIAWRINGESGAFRMPQTPGEIVERIAELYRTFGVKKAFIEDVPKFTGAKLPGSTMAVLFHNYGFVEGALMAIGFEVVRIKPQAWQKRLGLSRDKGMKPVDWKRKLKAEAERRFPDIAVTLKNADALLILLAGEQV